LRPSNVAKEYIKALEERFIKSDKAEIIQD
jgi:hypothetical protein